MLIDAMGLILADHKRVHLGELTLMRALAAVPFAGRYRIIDFILSNMVNSGIRNVGIVTAKKYRSLMDHIGTGAHWDLDRMEQGVTLLPPFVTSSARPGDEADLSGLYDFVSRSHQSHVIVADTNVIMNHCLTEYLEAHRQSDAEITILYNQDGKKEGAPVYSLNLERGIVKDVLLDVPDPPTRRNAIGIMILSRQLLVSILEQSIARGKNFFSIEAILRRHDEFKIHALEYRGLVLRINSIASYFRSSLRMLEDDVRAEIFNREHPIYTKVKNEPPARYLEGNTSDNVLVSDGCTIAGKISNSVIFRGCSIGKHAVLENCVLMQNTVVGEGTVLKNVITDKNCVIRAGAELKGQEDYPLVIRKGVEI